MPTRARGWQGWRSRSGAEAQADTSTQSRPGRGRDGCWMERWLTLGAVSSDDADAEGTDGGVEVAERTRG
jgi:hypothetical protein